jgi:hypothetical protein
LLLYLCNSGTEDPKWLRTHPNGKLVFKRKTKGNLLISYPWFLAVPDPMVGADPVFLPVEAARLRKLFLASRNTPGKTAKSSWETRGRDIWVFLELLRLVVMCAQTSDGETEPLRRFERVKRVRTARLDELT